MTVIARTWTTRLLAAGLMLCTWSAVSAQFDMGESAPPPGKAWEQFKLDSKKTVKLSFRNASPDAVIDLFSRMSGINIVKDPQLRDPLTVTSASPVKLTVAFEILDTALGLRGYEMSKDGSLLVIRKRQERRQSTGFDPAMLAQMMGQRNGEGVLRVYRIRYASSSQVARVINEVFLQQQQQNPFMAFMQAQQNQGPRGRGGRGMPGATNTQQTVRASSDDYSNTVVVNAPESKQNEVEDLITEIDQPTDQPQNAQVYLLKNAYAEEMAPVIQNVLTSNAPTGRGSSGSNPQVGFAQRFQQAFRFGNSGASFGQVIADPRTNALIVTATEDNQRIVAQVINQLDLEVKPEATTFVLPIQNARADDVATLLNQAFSNSGVRGNTRGGTTTRNNTRNNTNNRRNNNNRGGTGGFGGGGFGGGGFGGRGVEDGAPADGLEVPVTDPTLDESDLLTQVTVDQGMPPLPALVGAGQPSGGAAIQPRDRTVRQLNLSGQITVIPDPNTNRLIVVASPENYELIQQIVGEIDAIPEQVMIETMIVEATLDKSSKLGVEWNLIQPKAFGDTGVTGNIGSDFGLAGSGSAGRPPEGFRYTLSGGNLDAFINALQTDDKYQVLSTPRIFTSNNVEAEINISQRVPYVVSTREDSNGNLTFNYSFQDVGIVLNVTPRITQNGFVTLDVVQTANDLQGFTDFNAPIINQREADTTVTVLDGETIILGGMIRNLVTSKVKKLPLLGDIPILGNLFRSTSKVNTKTELLVFLTPRVVRDAQQAKNLRERTESEISPAVKRQIEDSKPKTGETNANP